MTWPRSALLSITFTILSLIVIALHLVPYGAPNVWQWQYLPLDAPGRILFPVLAFLVFLAALGGPVRRLWFAHRKNTVTRGGEIKALAALWAACVSMSLAVALMHPWGFWHLTSLVINPASNSYYSTALTSPPARELLQDYHKRMPRYVAHAQTQSAGPVVLCGLLHRAFSAAPLTQDVAETLLALSPGISAETAAGQANALWKTSLSPADAAIALLIALFLIGFGSLAVAPIYYLAKWLYGGQVALIAASAWPLLPSFHSFTVSIDQIYPLVAGLALCGIYRGVKLLSPGQSEVRRGALMILTLTGALVGIGLFFNVGLLMLLPMCLVFALLQRPLASPRQLGIGALSFGLGLLAPLILLKVVFGFDWLVVFRTSNALNYALHYEGTRSYVVSLGSNLWDFFTFAGAPVTCYFFYRLWLVLRATRHHVDGADRRREFFAAPLLWAVVATLLLLDFSGKTRGEVARMWMLLYPAIIIEAAAAFRGLAQVARWPALSMALLQWAWVVTLAYYVRVWGY